jgi:SAM-dependent methyltransferase
MTTTPAPPAAAPNRPGVIGRIRSRQAGHPTGLLGRIIGRVMVKDTAEANDRALELLDLSAPRTLLEIGFGQGRTAAKLLERGHRIIGTEVSEAMVSQAAARNRKACADGRAELISGDGRLVPFPDDAADGAFTTHTIYFMSNPATTIADVARVLRPGGRLVIACRVAEDGMPAWMDPDVYRIPTIAEVKFWLGQAGFVDVSHHEGDESTHFTHWFAADLP